MFYILALGKSDKNDKSVRDILRSVVCVADEVGLNENQLSSLVAVIELPFETSRSIINLNILELLYRFS